MTEYEPHLHLIPGISASGKTTMARYLSERLSAEGIRTSHVIPHTTRSPRPHEEEGVDYYFHTKEAFEASHPRVADEDIWRYSKIGDHYYFNSDKATLPTPESPIKVLPVAFSEVETIVEDYRQETLQLSVAPIVIAPDIKGRWLTSVYTERPERDLEAELQKQADALEALTPYIDTVFTPRWQSKQDDLQAYYHTVVNTVLQLKK